MLILCEIVAALLVSTAPNSAVQNQKSDDPTNQTVITPTSVHTPSSEAVPVKALELYKEGNRLIFKDKFEEALKKFDGAVKIYPKYADAYRGMGVCYAKLGKQDKAIVAYEKFLQLSPQAEDAKIVREIVNSYKKK